MANLPFGSPSILKIIAKILAKTSQQENGNYAKILATCEAFDTEVSNHELLALAASVTRTQEDLFELLSKGERYVEEHLIQRANEVCNQHDVKLEVVQGQWFGSLIQILCLVAPEDKVQSIMGMRTKLETELLASAAEELNVEITVIDADCGNRSSTRAKNFQTRLSLIKYKNGLYSIVTSPPKLTGERQVINEVHAITEDCRRYPQSMVIFDLDSLAGVSKEYSELAASETNSSGTPICKILRPDVLEECLRMMTMWHEDPRENTMWLVALSGHNHILQLFNEKLAWPKAAPPAGLKKLFLQENNDK